MIVVGLSDSSRETCERASGWATACCRDAGGGRVRHQSFYNISFDTSVWLPPKVESYASVCTQEFARALGEMVLWVQPHFLDFQDNLGLCYKLGRLS